MLLQAKTQDLELHLTAFLAASVTKLTKHDTQFSADDPAPHVWSCYSICKYCASLKLVAASWQPRRWIISAEVRNGPTEMVNVELIEALLQYGKKNTVALD